jgi:hypothetical protein
VGLLHAILSLYCTFEIAFEIVFIVKLSVSIVSSNLLYLWAPVFRHSRKRTPTEDIYTEKAENALEFYVKSSLHIKMALIFALEPF